MRKLEGFIVPEARRLLFRRKDLQTDSNMLSWMIQGSKNDLERDPKILARLAAGGTHSVGMFIGNALFDLVADPELLDAVRDEIKKTHHDTNRLWDLGAFEGLQKLDSALKETARVGPPTMTVLQSLDAIRLHSIQRSHPA